QIGLDLELGARGGEGQRGAGDREERGIGDPDTPGETGQDHRSEEERQSPFEEGHVRSLERPPGHGEPAGRLPAAPTEYQCSSVILMPSGPAWPATRSLAEWSVIRTPFGFLMVAMPPPPPIAPLASTLV